MSLSLREIIQEIAREIIERDFGTPCKVLSYNSENNTIDAEPINGKADFLDVKLMSENKDGVLFVPKEGSIVIVEQTSNDTAYVTMFGEVDSIKLMSGENKGLVKISELVQKINVIENDINNLKTAFNSWVAVPNDGGAALKLASTSWFSQQLTPTQIDDLENKKITH